MSKGVATLSAKALRKLNFRTRLNTLLAKYPVFLIIQADNVGSKQLQTIRQSLRGSAEILMGKNTMIRKVLRDSMDKIPSLEAAMPYIQGNTGLVFTDKDVRDVRSALLAVKVQRAAKPGAVAPVDVHISAGNTNLEPTKTSFFQALSIPSRINKGMISLDNGVHVVKAGQRVTHSQAALLQMLKMKPFQYGVSVKAVYDSSGYAWHFHDSSCGDDTLSNSINTAIANVAALSTAIGYPTQASILYSMRAAVSNVAGLTAATRCTFPQSLPKQEVEPGDDDSIDFDTLLFGPNDDDEEENTSSKATEKSTGEDDDEENATVDEPMPISLFGNEEEEW